MTLSRHARVQRNMKPIRSPRTPEADLRASQPAGGQAGSPGQLGSRLSGQREPTVTTPEQLQPYLVQLNPHLSAHKEQGCPYRSRWRHMLRKLVVRHRALGGGGLARPSALQHTIIYGRYCLGLIPMGAYEGAACSSLCVLILSDPCRTPLQEPPAPWAPARQLPTACMETLAWGLGLRPVRRHRWGTAHRRALGPCLFWQAARSPSIGHLVRCALHACHCSKTILQPRASQCLLLLHKSRRAEAPRSLCAEAGINLS